MSLMNRLNRLANSPQGRKLADKAKDVANDPKTKARIEEAKRKLAERRGGGAKPSDPPPPA